VAAPEQNRGFGGPGSRASAGTPPLHGHQRSPPQAAAGQRDPRGLRHAGKKGGAVLWAAPAWGAQAVGTALPRRAGVPRGGQRNIYTYAGNRGASQAMGERPGYGGHVQNRKGAGAKEHQSASFVVYIRANAWAFARGARASAAGPREAKANLGGSRPTAFGVAGGPPRRLGPPNRHGGAACRLRCRGPPVWWVAPNE
jgi:hypothetical protein